MAVDTFISVKTSTNTSIIIQLIIGIITLRGITLNVPEKHKILIDILIMETLVQFAELLFYIFVLQKMVSRQIEDMGTMRYYDWFITTPTMLITTIIYFKYEEQLEKIKRGETGVLFRFSDFISENRKNIFLIVLLNFFMLWFGYLGEIEEMDKVQSTVVGFIFLLFTFKIIYSNYAVKSEVGKKIFYLLFFIWSLYGFAFMLDTNSKNNMFNLLDIFAKNFFGLFIYYKASQIAI
jgi:hypothetical protein